MRIIFFMLLLLGGLLMAAPIVTAFELSDDFEDGNTNGWTTIAGGTFVASSSSPLNGSYSGLLTGTAVSGGRKTLFETNYSSMHKITVKALLQCTDDAGVEQCAIGFKNDSLGTGTVTELVRYSNAGTGWEYRDVATWQTMGLTDRNIELFFSITNHTVHELKVNGSTIATNYQAYPFNLSNYSYFQLSGGFSGDNANVMIDDLYISRDSLLSAVATDENNNSLNDFTISIYDGTSLLATNFSAGTVAYINMSNVSLAEGNYTLRFNKSGHVTTDESFEYLNNSPIRISFYAPHAPSISVSFYDEETRQKINNVTYKLFIDSFAKEYTTTTGTSGFIDINHTGVLEIEYSSENYYLNHYYANLTPQTNLETNLYLLNSSKSDNSLMRFTATDISGDLLSNATIKLLRRYVVDNTNTFEIVSMAKTDINGEGGLYVQFNDATYQFIIESEDQTILTTNPTEIYATPITLRGSLFGNIIETISDFSTISSEIEYDNLLFNNTFVDLNNNVDQACFNIYRVRGSRANQLINSSCVSSASGGFSLGILNQSGTYRAELVVTIDGSDYLIDELTQKVSNVASIVGLQGVFFLAILVIVAGLLGVYSPLASIILAAVASIIGGMIGFIGIGWGVTLWVAVIAGVYLYALRGRYR